MKYILMMNTTMRAGEEVPVWPKADLQSHVAFMASLTKDLNERGELVAAEGLAFPNEAKLVRAGKDGRPITEGVFPESKEFLAGFWIVDVEGPERAIEIAARISTAPGPGGALLQIPVEVRPVMNAAPAEML